MIRMKEVILWVQESCEWRDRNLAEDHPSRLVSQHALAGAYQANGQVKEAVKLLEHVHKIRQKVVTELIAANSISQDREEVFRVPGAWPG